MTRRIAVRGIIIKNDKVLAVKHKNADGDEVDFWAIPGGGLNPHESLADGLTREILEELGVVPKLGRLLFIQQYRDEKREYLELFFHITNAENFQDIDLASTSHGTLEISRCEFIDSKKEHLLPTFLQSVDITAALAESSPIQIESYL